jgi:N6-L-threonylcarbamoyladenine synthase
MLILGIDSSCDDMSASVVEDGRNILSNIVSSQDEIHTKYGGIVPELAARQHTETVVPVVEEALRKAGVEIDDIDGIGVTQGPGLIVSLLIGLSYAKALSFAKDIPYVGINHLEGHIGSIFLESDEITFPYIALVVSGGHTLLCEVKSYDEYTLLGQTRDDAAGEAFDKVAKLLGLGYPGGVVIDRMAQKGNPKTFSLPRAYLSKDSLDFSFSGLKSAVYRLVDGMRPDQIESALNDLVASFQEAVIDVLVDKTIMAANERGIKDLLVTGGVAANSRLRCKMSERAEENGMRLFLPSPSLCTDNGAMIAAVAYHRLKKGMTSSLNLNAEPNLQIGENGSNTAIK